MRILAPALVTLVAAVPAVGQETVYAEIQPGVGVSVELGGGESFQEVVTYSLYFLSDSSSLETGVISAQGQTQTKVFLIGAGDLTRTATVEQCQLVEAAPVCDPLEEPAVFDIDDDPDAGPVAFLTIEIPEQRIDWEHGFLRLNMAAGRYVLSVVADDGAAQAPRDAPAIENATLPTLSDLEQQYLVQRPFLHLKASPLVRSQTTGEGGFDDLGLSFSGGMFRVTGGGSTRLELTWDGEVATNDSAAFNHVALDAGVARNLWPSDWLPLRLTVKGESDQGFKAFDLSANASLTFVLPFNVNLQSGSYRPALSPLLKLLAAYGSALDREAGQIEGSFARVGYEIGWRVPVGEANLVRFRHANVWNDPAGEDASWHTLWDIQVDVAVGGMTYFIGYQKGEAAPLFQPIETTRMGFSFAIANPTGSGG